MLLSRRKVFFGNMFPSLVTKQTSRRNSFSTAMSHSLARPSDYHKMMSKNVQNGSSGTTSRMGDTVCLFVCLFVCFFYCQVFNILWHHFYGRQELQTMEK